MVFRIKYLMVVIFSASIFHNCASDRPKKISFDIGMAKKMFSNSKNVLLLPCVACGSFQPALAAAYKKDSVFFKSIYIVTDTACSKFPFESSHISQRNLDSLSDEFYNVTLIQFKGERYKVRIINSEEIGELLKISRTFFNNSF